MTSPSSLTGATVVVAGAGTGKTHALVDRYLRTILGVGEEPIAPERVLAITFTDKAANEMRARVQRRLGDLLFHPEREAALLDDARAQDRSPDARLIENVRRAVTGAPIATFHAFCARVLRDHALAAALDPSFSILDPDDEYRLLSETAEACVVDALSRGEPEVAELAARIALHGFGERKGLVECLVDLHGTLAERGVSAWSLALAATPEIARANIVTAFTDVDAAVAKLRAAGAAVQNVRLRCASIEQAKAALLGAWSATAATTTATATATAAAAVTASDDPEVRVARAFDDLRGHVSGNWGGPRVTDERRAIVAAVDAVGAALVDAFTAALAPAVRALIVELDERQRREKRARSFLGFGDLLIETRDLLRDDADVRERVRSRFARVLVDEYQDTSPVQEAVLALLTSDGPGAFVVGDPKQSIYSFRGADSSVFTRALAGAEAREELAISRRSLTPLVDVANLVAQRALPRGSFGVDETQLIPLTALRGDDGLASAGEHWRVAEAGDDSVELPPHERESIVVAKKLREKIDAGEFTARDVAILVRRGKASVPLARALSRTGLASVVVGGDGFYVRPEIADVVAALTLAADPADELAVLTVLRSPLVALTDDAILGLYAALPERRGLTWARVVELCAADRVRAFDAVLATVKKRLHHPTFERSGLARAIDAILDDAGYAAACAVEPDAELRLRNLEKLRAIVEMQKESSLVTLARLAAAIDDPPPEPLAAAAVDEADAVRIMTIHQAKGLEFKVVVLADAGSGLKGETDDVAFDVAAGLAVTARGRPIALCAQRSGRSGAPTAIQRVRRRLRDRNECELARLLYVAVTRARDRLYVVGAPRRNGPGSLLGALDLVRAADTPRFDALLPRIDVDATPPRSAPPLGAPSRSDSPPRPNLGRAPERFGAETITGSNAAELSIEPKPNLFWAWASLERGGDAGGGPPSSGAGDHPVRRVRASRLASAVDRQLGFALPASATAQASNAHGLDDDKLPPRPAGRLAHAIVALVATEARESLSDWPKVRAAVERAARSCGVVDAPAHLLDRCAATLHGPLRALVDAGASLSFEESLWLESDGVVVEGNADLVARLGDRCIVVELKLAAARAKAAQLQVAAYAAALEKRGEHAVHVTAWALGDVDPPAPSPFGRAHKNALDRALFALQKM